MLSMCRSTVWGEIPNATAARSIVPESTMARITSSSLRERRQLCILQPPVAPQGEHRTTLDSHNTNRNQILTHYFQKWPDDVREEQAGGWNCARNWEL